MNCVLIFSFGNDRGSKDTTELRQAVHFSSSHYEAMPTHSWYKVQRATNAERREKPGDGTKRWTNCRIGGRAAWFGGRGGDGGKRERERERESTKVGSSSTEESKFKALQICSMICSRSLLQARKSV